MRLGREMDGNEADVEREQQSGEQTASPARPVGRAMEALRAASVRHQCQESSFPVRSPSTIEFVTRDKNTSRSHMLMQRLLMVSVHSRADTWPRSWRTLPDSPRYKSSRSHPDTRSLAWFPHFHADAGA